MKSLLHSISKHHLLILSIFYFIFLLINLTLLPIFNDESIYLDWGWISLHVPGNAFLSLTDAKQPLLIWIFGIFATVFPDPLVAGRLVSVLIGTLTIVGVYSLAKKLFDKQTAFFASLIYAIMPIFVFYNRQALMEASIGCVGIWSGSILLSLLQKSTLKRGVLLGIILGLGFFIKSSALLFIISAAVVILFYLWREKKKTLFSSFLAVLGGTFIVDFFLLTNPLFWQTFSSNDRYAYTAEELLLFPFIQWLISFYGFLQIGFVYVTPLVFIAALWGMYLLIKKSMPYSLGILCYFILALLLEIFTVKSQSQRYLVDFLPFFSIPAAYVFKNLWQKNNIKKTLVIISLLISFALSLMVLFVPDAYIMQTAKISPYSDTEDTYGYTAGYGINQTIQYIQAHSVPSQPTMVLFALWTGNPENALDVYSFKSQNLFPLRIDSKLFPNINNYQCMTSSYPLFFVTRDGNLAGMDKYFSLEKTIPTHDPAYSIKIYTLKKDCKGKTVSLSDAYLPLINKELEIKMGQ